MTTHIRMKARNGLRYLGLLVLLVLALPAWAAQLVSVKGQVLNMRNGPGQQHEVLWQLHHGYPMKVIGQKGRWLRVRDFENDTGWVARHLTSRTPHHVVKSKVANIRKGAGLQHRVVDQAVYGEVLRTLGKRSGWVKVEQEDGTRGWVSAKLLWGW